MPPTATAMPSVTPEANPTRFGRYFCPRTTKGLKIENFPQQLSKVVGFADRKAAITMRIIHLCLFGSKPSHQDRDHPPTPQAKCHA